LEKPRAGFCWEAEVGTVLGTAHELDATGKDAKCQTLDLLQIWNSMFTEVVNPNNVCDMSADRVRIFSNPNCADFILVLLRGTFVFWQTHVLRQLTFGNFPC
tara:strand:- start:1522 stop:1827 length:306 start_codon:yes stop_codon:yes gene_type:complete